MRESVINCFVMQRTEQEKAESVLRFRLGNPDDINVVRAYLTEKKIMPDTLLTLSVKKFSAKRTLDQNALLHWACDLIASQEGYYEPGMDRTDALDNIKEGLKWEYGVKWKVKVAKDKWEMVPKPTHLQTIQEIEQLFEGMFYEMAQLGIDHERLRLEWGTLKGKKTKGEK